MASKWLRNCARILSQSVVTAVAVGGLSISVQAQVLEASAEQDTAQSTPQNGPPPSVRGGPPPSVFDGDYITLGVGVGMAPSYEGSDNYDVIPTPRIAGSVGGIDFSSPGGGPGLALDLVPDKPRSNVDIIAGPAFRVNLNRTSLDGIEDSVVRQLGDLETAVEVGVELRVRFNGALTQSDSVTIGTTMLFDAAGAHESSVITPSIRYSRPISEAYFMSFNLSATHVGDGYARYYYGIDAAGSSASNLPVFDAEGGFKSVGLSVLSAYDLSGNALDGGWSAFAIAGVSRLLNVAAQTPITLIRGDRNQAFVALGIGYTF
jgi:outer membrane scaffolding protein for murein synthesis (MipA/OmpV family)